MISNLKATIVEDDNALISVDDLIMQIGLLNVKIMEKDKVIQSVFNRLQELEKQNSEMSSKVDELTAYKNDYDVLARRFNELQERLKEREVEIVNYKNMVAQKEAEIAGLREMIDKLQTKRKK